MQEVPVLLPWGQPGCAVTPGFSCGRRRAVVPALLGPSCPWRGSRSPGHRCQAAPWARCLASALPPVAFGCGEAVGCSVRPGAEVLLLVELKIPGTGIFPSAGSGSRDLQLGWMLTGLTLHQPNPACPKPSRVLTGSPASPLCPIPAVGVLSLPLFLAWLLQPLPPGARRHPCCPQRHPRCHPCCPRCCPQLPHPGTTSPQHSGGRRSWGCLSLPTPRLPGLSPRCLHLPRASVSPS